MSVSGYAQVPSSVSILLDVLIPMIALAQHIPH